MLPPGASRLWGPVLWFGMKVLRFRRRPIQRRPGRRPDDHDPLPHRIPGGAESRCARPLARFAARPPSRALSRGGSTPMALPATSLSTKVPEYVIQQLRCRSAETGSRSEITSVWRSAGTGRRLRMTILRRARAASEAARSRSRETGGMRNMRTIVTGMALSLFLLGLAGCESRQPATRAGEALDRAGTKTGQAVGQAATATGRALNRAGNYIQEKVSQ